MKTKKVMENQIFRQYKGQKSQRISEYRYILHEKYYNTDLKKNKIK